MHARRLYLSLAALTLSAGLAHAAAPAPPGAGNVMSPGQAPTPFSAQQIRTGCPDGRMITFRIAKAGQPEVWQHMEFLGDDADQASVKSTMLTADGNPMGDSATNNTAWGDLQAHAAFPDDATVIIPMEDVGSELGPGAGWLYRVRVDNAGESLYWFDAARPGPPVRVLQRDSTGVTVLDMTMVADQRAR